MTTRRSLSTEALMRAARALRFALILQGAVRWGVLSAGGLLALLVVDDLLHLPQALRLPLAVVLGGFIAVEFYRKVLVLVLRRFSPAQAARWLETHRGIAGNVLINAYQFEGEAYARGFGEVHAVHAGFLEFDPGGDSAAVALADAAQLKKWLIGLLGVTLVWTLLDGGSSRATSRRAWSAFCCRFPTCRRWEAGRLS